MEIRELHAKKEMLAQFTVMTELYPNLTLSYYEEMLDEMLLHNYHQIGVFKDEKCIALSGYWLGTKLWCGKYLELDNVIVSKKARGTGAGKFMEQYLAEKATQLGCHILVLDAYAQNFSAHRFYYNQGYAPRGFHFIKFLNEAKLT